MFIGALAVTPALQAWQSGCVRQHVQHARGHAAILTVRPVVYGPLTKSLLGLGRTRKSKIVENTTKKWQIHPENRG